jgi:hypothetical protein
MPPLPKLVSVSDEAEPTKVDKVPPSLLQTARPTVPPAFPQSVRPSGIRPLPPRPAPRATPLPVPSARESSEAIEISNTGIVEIRPLDVAPPAPAPEIESDDVFAQLRPRPVIVLRTAWFFATYAARGTWAWLLEQLPRARAGALAEWTRARERAQKG